MGNQNPCASYEYGEAAVILPFSRKNNFSRKCSCLLKLSSAASHKLSKLDLHTSASRLPEDVGVSYERSGRHYPEAVIRVGSHAIASALVSFWHSYGPAIGT